MSIKKIGPYLVQGVLGRGGMGTVYRGQHFETEELHAIKVLSPAFADDPHFRGRFESEIQALLKLNHENIVSLLSYGQDDGQLFFAMELVQGQSLFQLQKARHRFDWRQVLAIAVDCANGLRHAHDRGIIHRDLKPGNLMMADADGDRGPQVKLTDFGIAKRFGNSQNTGTNILGTLDFMSPEQAKGEPATARSDLYSLGTVLYTLLSGRPPFSGNSVEESLRNLTRVPAPLVSKVNPDVPQPLEVLISKMMEKKPEYRIPTALALLHKLGDIEMELRDDSEARTAHQPGAKTVEEPHPAGDRRRSSATVSDRSPATAVEREPRRPSATPASPTVALDMQEELKLEPSSEERKDFLNTVTDTVRQREFETDTAKRHTSKGLLPLLLAFAVVLIIGVYGWFLATAPPTAEQLFGEIQARSSQPDRVVDEINQFLSLYPEDHRAENVTQLQAVANAIYNYRTLVTTLTVRSRSPDGITDIESKFLDIAREAKDSPLPAQKKMKSFVSVYEGFELKTSEQACIEAARGYSVKLKYERRTKAMQQMSQIQKAIKHASELEDPQEAIQLYRSTRQLFKDVDLRALPDRQQGAAVLSNVKEQIFRLENEIRMRALQREQEQKAAQQQPSEEPVSGSTP